MTLGVHFAIDEPTADRLRTAADDDEVALLVEEIENEMLGVDHCDTDKAWDAIHRSLTDGRLEFENGDYPLNAAILGGVQLHEGDDYIVSLLSPGQVRDVATAVEAISREALETGYRLIDPEDYGPNFGNEDFEYTWSNFGDLVEFFRQSAVNHMHVIFTVGL